MVKLSIFVYVVGMCVGSGSDYGVFGLSFLFCLVVW